MSVWLLFFAACGQVHQWVGNAFVLLVLSHVALMATATSAVGKSPLSAFPDDYTVTVSRAT